MQISLREMQLFFLNLYAEKNVDILESCSKNIMERLLKMSDTKTCWTKKYLAKNWNLLLTFN